MLKGEYKEMVVCKKANIKKWYPYVQTGPYQDNGSM